MSPYSGGQSDVVTKTGHRFAWARLNADALFIALLAIGAGLADILDPFDDHTISEIGFPTPSFYLRCVMYIAGGLLLLFALIRQHVPTEVIGRTIITTGAAFEFYRCSLIFGVGDPDAYASFMLFLIVFCTSGLRMSVLLSSKGLVVRLPERNPSPLTISELKVRSKGRKDSIRRDFDDSVEQAADHLEEARLHLEVRENKDRLEREKRQREGDS